MNRARRLKLIVLEPVDFVPTFSDERDYWFKEMNHALDRYDYEAFCHARDQCTKHIHRKQEE
jgi:hypothetical protein